jgi:hypothetical protein
MKHLAAAFLLSTSVLVAAATSQACSDLTVSGSVTPGSTLTISVTGATANAPTVLVVGEDPGTTVINLGPLASLTLGIAEPFSVIGLPPTDGTGSTGVSFAIPANIPSGSFPMLTLYAQAVSASFSVMPPAQPGLSFCLSDVETITVG